LAYEDSRFAISRELCAKNILPFLIASAMENSLNIAQFEQYMSLIHRILEKVNIRIKWLFSRAPFTVRILSSTKRK
uniref:Four helix bundle protein n=1 Tax=Gongylonema pulchrum TaxID=637853 RepID=A0A183ET05_9BILA